MSAETTLFFRREFDQFASELQRSWAITESSRREIENTLKAAHKDYLSFASLCACLAEESDDRSVYIRAAPEAVYLSLVLALRGLSTTHATLMRQCIELSLKHIYFATHPMEFSWVRSRVGFREINFQFLVSYLKKSDEIAHLGEGAELLQDLEEQFHLLSRFVHVHSGEFMIFANLQDGVVGKNDFAALAKQVRVVLADLGLLLLSFFPQQFLAASQGEKALIRSLLPPGKKKCLNTYLKLLATKQFVPIGTCSAAHPVWR